MTTFEYLRLVQPETITALRLANLVTLPTRSTVRVKQPVLSDTWQYEQAMRHDGWRRVNGRMRQVIHE